jgi:hypothetical protein
MRKATLRDAVALLDLPSRDHVGAELLSRGITDGDQEDCFSCPIAQFLALETGKRVSVGTAGAYPGRYSNRAVALPRAAVQFIAWFDAIGDE